MSRDSKLIVFVAVLASLLEIIDTSIVNVALPTMMGNLGATLEDISMVVTGYAIANAIVLPVSAWLSERLGRRQYYLGCILAFIATSVACGLAPNLTALIIFRILQGLAGGALLPTSQTLIYEQFPREKAGMAGAIFGMSVMVGPALGPVVGGYLTDTLGWRSIFNINLPLGLLALFIGGLVIHNPSRQMEKKGKHPPLDWLGLALLVLGVGCLQFVLERGEADDWFSSTTIVINTIMFVACIPGFIWWQLKTEHPIINVRLIKESPVQNGVMLMGILGFFLYSVVFLLPVFLEQAYHYDATQIGEMFIPGSLLTMAMMPLIGRMMQAGVSTKLMILVGFLGIELCLHIMTGFDSQTSKSDVLWALYARGFALSFLFVPINSSILSEYTGVNLAQVSGLLNLFRQIGGSMGIAMVATLLNMRSHQNYADLSMKVTALHQNTMLFLHQMQAGMAHKFQSEVGMFDALNSPSLKVLYYKVQSQVFMMSFLQLIFTLMIIVAVAVIPLWRLKLRSGPVAVVDAH